MQKSADRGGTLARVSGPTLLATKLAPPLRRGLMHRRRLVQALDGSARHRLTLLVAPAGWGKTSLLADWHTTGRRQRVGWLALDPEDSDPVRFWTYLITAVRTVLPGVGEHALGTLRVRGRALLDAALPALLNDLAALREDVHLVLDDYHVLSDPELHRSVAYLLAHQPPRLHLVIATRSDPPLPFGRLRLHGEVLEIRAQDLAFTDSEATTMLNGALALGLDARDIERLGARTEGWAAGLYLAGLSLREHTDRAAFVEKFHGTDRFVLDFLGSEVLAAQPAQLRTFLLETSILPRLCAQLCQAVTGRDDSAALLETIERSNLFLVPLDSERHWFRYHRLFGELLRHQLGIAAAAVTRAAPASSCLVPRGRSGGRSDRSRRGRGGHRRCGGTARRALERLVQRRAAGHRCILAGSPACGGAARRPAVVCGTGLVRVAGAALSRALEPGVAEHFVTGLPQLAHALALAATGQVAQAGPAAARAVQLARRGAGRLEVGLALATQAQTLLAAAQDGAPVLAEAKRLARACRDPGWLPERLTRLGRTMTPAGSRPVSDGAAAVTLSERERELLPLLAGTLSQRELGAVLHLSLNTVKTHSRGLYRKLGASSRAEAVQRARQIGLL